MTATWHCENSTVARTTVEGYLAVLEDTLLVQRLPAFEARLRARERKHPKLSWVDAGVARAAKGTRGPIAPEEAGALLEGWVHTLLRTYMAERELAEEVAYWAPAESSKLEVDFVLRRGSDLCAIEVKSGRRTDPGQLAGLRAIGELPGMRRRILVHRGAHATMTEDGIETWPFETFVESLAEDRLWP